MAARSHGSILGTVRLIFRWCAMPCLVVALSLGAGLGVVLLATSGVERAASLEAVGLAAALAVPIALGGRRLLQGDWFHPLAFPSLYVAGAFLIPALYLLVVRQPLGSVAPEDVSASLVFLFILTALGATLGIILGLRFPWRRDRGDHIRHTGLRAIGRSLLLIAVVLRLSTAAGAAGLPYGFASVADYGFDRSLDNVGIFFAFAGVILIVVSNVRIVNRVTTSTDLILFATFAGATFALGSRGELVAPLLFALWAHHTYVRPVRFLPAAVLVLTLVFVFQGVGATRVGAPFYESTSGVVERTLQPFNTPVQITGDLVQIVPASTDYEAGATYWAALQRQLPSFVSVPLLGEPENTATFLYRDLIGFTNPNAGFAFALPSEAYLNFGPAGVFVIPALVGLLLGYAYRRQDQPPTRAIHLLYPVILATLPLSLRSDSVLQVKAVLYPLVIIAISFWAMRPAEGYRRFAEMGSRATH